MEHSKEKWQANRSLQECINQMYQNHLNTGDVTIQVGKDGGEVKSHKFILMCRSSVYSSMFQEQPDSPIKMLKIYDIEKDVFLQFLEFLYTDKTRVTADNFSKLLHCAKNYEVETLSSHCKTSMKGFISSDIFCSIMECAYVYNESEIMDICLNTIKLKAPHFLFSDVFLKLCQTCVYKIVQNDGIYSSEEVLFERVIKWSEEECKRQKMDVTAENQRKALGDILCEIRFPIMDHLYLGNVVCGSDVLTDKEKVEIWRHQMNKDAVSSGLFKTQRRMWQPVTVVNHYPHGTTELCRVRIRETDVFTVTFKVSSYSVLLGVFLNVANYDKDSAKPYKVCIDIKSGAAPDIDVNFEFDFVQIKENVVKFDPNPIPLRENTEYTVSARIQHEHRNWYKHSRGIIINSYEECPDFVHTAEFNNKTLTMCGSDQTRPRKSDMFIRGFYIT